MAPFSAIPAEEQATPPAVDLGQLADQMEATSALNLADLFMESAAKQSLADEPEVVDISEVAADASTAFEIPAATEWHDALVADPSPETEASLAQPVEEPVLESDEFTVAPIEEFALESSTDFIPPVTELSEIPAPQFDAMVDAMQNQLAGPSEPAPQFDAMVDALSGEVADSSEPASLFDSTVEASQPQHVAEAAEPPTPVGSVLEAWPSQLDAAPSQPMMTSAEESVEPTDALAETMSTAAGPLDGARPMEPPAHFQSAVAQDASGEDNSVLAELFGALASAEQVDPPNDSADRTLQSWFESASPVVASEEPLMVEPEVVAAAAEQVAERPGQDLAAPPLEHAPLHAGTTQVLSMLETLADQVRSGEITVAVPDGAAAESVLATLLATMLNRR